MYCYCVTLVFEKVSCKRQSRESRVRKVKLQFLSMESGGLEESDIMIISG